MLLLIWQLLDKLGRVVVVASRLVSSYRHNLGRVITELRKELQQWLHTYCGSSTFGKAHILYLVAA